MKKIVCLLIIIMSLVHVSESYAVSTTFEVSDFRIAVWREVVIVDTLNENQEDTNNPDACDKGGRRFALSNDLANSDYMKAVLLEARANQKSIFIVVNGCSNGFPNIVAIKR